LSFHRAQCAEFRFLLLNNLVAKFLIAFTINVFGLPVFALAQEIDFEKKFDILGLASSCYSCHSTMSSPSSKMSLNNYDEKQFIVIFKRYRDQSEPNPNVMNYIAKGYTDLEIELLAQYFTRKR
jgi:cytochrome c553